MSTGFGDALRKARQSADKTLGDVARLLDVSIVYVSDVERGNRRPFNNERIIKIAEFIETDPAPLIAAADVDHGVIKYEIIDDKPLEAAVVGNLVSGLARGGVTDVQLRKIRDVLENSD